MEKLSITLPEKMVDHVQEQVNSGRYASTSEYIRDALRERIEWDEEVAMMKERCARARDQVKQGHALSHEEVFRRLEGGPAGEGR